METTGLDFRLGWQGIQHGNKSAGDEKLLLKRMQCFKTLMRNSFSTLIPMACCGLMLHSAQSAGAGKNDATKKPIISLDVKSFVEKHCTLCRHGVNAPAGIDLSSIGFGVENAHTLNMWVSAHDAVRGL